MVNQNLKLTVLHDDNVSFEDLSFYAYDFSKDAFDLQLLTTSYLYVGYYKPINSLFFQINTANTISNTLSLEYYNGSSWTELEATDDTLGFTRSGFINWNRNLENDSLTSVNSVSKYWIRIKTSANHTTTTLQAINFVFCDDNDLKYEVPEITDSNHLAGKTSHILTHVAVRNEIIQTLNNKDLKHINQTTGLKEDLTCWDILDANQLKQACVYLALAKIYFNFSDSTDDKYYQKYKDYTQKYRDAFQLTMLALDTDDDGKKDNFETQSQNLLMKRITR